VSRAPAADAAAPPVNAADAAAPPVAVPADIAVSRWLEGYLVDVEGAADAAALLISLFRGVEVA
jgi:hypothetical protein